MPKPSRRLRFSLAFLLLLVTLIALALGSYRAWQIASERAVLISIFGSEETMAILVQPDKVEAYRLEKRINTAFAEDLQEYPIKSGPLVVSARHIEEIQRVLSDRSTYYNDAPKACLPSPGVRLDFTKGNDRLHILLCFECAILESWSNGKLVGSGNFDHGHAKLLRIVKSIFPNDPEIQALRP